MNPKIYSDCLDTAFTLPSEVDLLAFEAGVGAKLPEQYRQFLLQHNGGYFQDVVVNFGGGLGDGLDYLSGIGASFPDAELGEDLDVFDDNDPLKILPIGYTQCGSFLLLGVADDIRGQVWVQISEDEEFKLIADSFIEFFGGLKVEKT
jgi:hypothetical protein